MSGNAQTERKYGSPAGLGIIAAAGFLAYFILSMLEKSGGQAIPDYNGIVADIHGKGTFFWFFMNFTEPNFFAGFASSLGVLIGACTAYFLAVKGSEKAGFEICYGAANIWPWVFASQIIVLCLSMFVCNYMALFDRGNTWIPTFIAIVNVPPALMLMYGPGIPQLITVCILGAFLCTPTAYWISNMVIAPWNIPNVVSNVGAMAIAGFTAASVCHLLPWMKKVPGKPLEKPIGAVNDASSPSWFVRRTLADFSEPLFYGNEIAGLFMLIGVVLDTVLNPGLTGYGTKCAGALVLSELLASGIGIFLYADKWEKNGWCATYVPAVSVAPACVLMFGGTIPVAVFSALMGAVIGAPVADFVGGKLPDYVPGTVANVTSMALCTILTAITMQALPWF